MTLRNTLFAVVSLIGLGLPSVASAEVCPATNVVGTIHWCCHQPVRPSNRKEPSVRHRLN